MRHKSGEVKSFVSWVKKQAFEVESDTCVEKTAEFIYYSNRTLVTLRFTDVESSSSFEHWILGFQHWILALNIESSAFNIESSLWTLNPLRFRHQTFQFPLDDLHVQAHQIFKFVLDAMKFSQNHPLKSNYHKLISVMWHDKMTWKILATKKNKEDDGTARKKLIFLNSKKELFEKGKQETTEY